MSLWNRGLLWVLCCACAWGFTSSMSAQTLSSTSSASSIQARDTVQLNSASRDESVELNSAPAELPDSPGAAQAQSSSAEQQSGSQGSANSTPPKPPQSSSGEQGQPHRPVGTAAAEAPKVSGITAAEPAGVAIAPAKQHRARSIVIKVGAIVGATAAIGTVVGLSAATHSKPPGAH